MTYEAALRHIRDMLLTIKDTNDIRVMRAMHKNMMDITNSAEPEAENEKPAVTVLRYPIGMPNNDRR